jgi:hypothetical protein
MLSISLKEEEEDIIVSFAVYKSNVYFLSYKFRRLRLFRLNKLQCANNYESPIIIAYI